VTYCLLSRHLTFDTPSLASNRHPHPAHGARGERKISMAEPQSPIIPGVELPEIVYAKDQPEYRPLPVFKDTDGTVLSRWRLTWKERFLVLFRGDVYLFVSTFNRPLQPLMMEIERPKVQTDEG
jgi:hypothetical protein